MLIGGLQKMTLIDFPGKIACTVFCLGCNFSCGWCYNSELVNPKKMKKHPQIPARDFFQFLDEQNEFLDGVCLTGGEPTIYQDLPEFIKKIKHLDLAVKLDTNGSHPAMLQKLFQENLLDFVAMDIKSSLEKYPEAVNYSLSDPPKFLQSKNLGGESKGLLNNIQKSINLIKGNNIDYEFRTTVIPGIIDEKEIKKISQWLKGAKHLALQQFRPEKTLDPSFEKVKPYSEEKFKKYLELARPYFEKVELRG